MENNLGEGTWAVVLRNYTIMCAKYKVQSRKFEDLIGFIK